MKINNLVISATLLFLVSCNVSFNPTPAQREVGINSYHFTVKGNIVNLTVDCDTTGDGVVDIKNVPVANSSDGLHIIGGLENSFNITGTLVEYSDHLAIERVYIK